MTLVYHLVLVPLSLIFGLVCILGVLALVSHC